MSLARIVGACLWPTPITRTEWHSETGISRAYSDLLRNRSYSSEAEVSQCILILEYHEKKCFSFCCHLSSVQTAIVNILRHNACDHAIAIQEFQRVGRLVPTFYCVFAEIFCSWSSYSILLRNVYSVFGVNQRLLTYESFSSLRVKLLRDARNCVAYIR